MNLDTDPNKPLKIGLVLSGGGIRAVAHLGVMKALTDRGITFSHISCASAGAVAASFFAEGYSPLAILKTIQEVHLLKLIRPSIGNTGFISIMAAQHFFNEYIPHNSFKKLKIPITVASVNLSLGKLVYFENGELDKCILASCCLPGIFRPIMIDGHMYIDGGVLNNFPAEPLFGKCDFIIGSSCNHMAPVKEIHNLGELIDRAALLAVSGSLNSQKELCNIVIEPEGLAAYGIFDVNAAEEIYMIGYEECLKTIERSPILQTILPENKK